MTTSKNAKISNKRPFCSLPGLCLTKISFQGVGKPRKEQLGFFFLGESSKAAVKTG